MRIRTLLAASALAATAATSPALARDAVSFPLNVGRWDNHKGRWSLQHGTRRTEPS